MTPADIDRLATLCRLSERGYTRDREGDWLDAEGFRWAPDQVDDDCQMVLAEFYRAAGPREQILFADALVDFTRCLGIAQYLEIGLLAKPAEKIKAVLSVLLAGGQS